MPEIVHIYSLIGNGVTAGNTVSSGGSVTTATLLIPLTPQNDRERTQQQVEAEMSKRLATLPGARVTIGGHGSGQKLTVTIAREETLMLQAKDEKVRPDNPT